MARRDPDLQELHRLYGKCEVEPLGYAYACNYTGYRIGRCRICGLAHKRSESAFQDEGPWHHIPIRRAAKLLRKHKEIVGRLREPNAVSDMPVYRNAIKGL